MNTLSFLAASGSALPLYPMQTLDTPGNTSGANYLGFFGAGGPQGSPYTIVVGQYQDTTHITNASGTNLGTFDGLPGDGRLINHKYLTNTTVSVSGMGSELLTSVPQGSGSLLIRFESGTSAQVQNSILRAVNLNASSGVSSLTGLVTDIDIRAYAVGDSYGDQWIQLGGTGASDNRLIMDDHSFSSTIHDYHVCISVSPESAGQKNAFGFTMSLEFL
jgi:hypothetical protein